MLRDLNSVYFLCLCRLSNELPPTNLQELHEKLTQQHVQAKDQHRMSTTSLPPMPTFDVHNEQRRMSTVSQPPSQHDYSHPQTETSSEDQQKKENGGSSQTPTESDVSTIEQVSEETDEKPRRKRSAKHSSQQQQLVIRTVDSEGTVECQLLCKQKTISFKFNRFDTSPSDIIEGLVKEELLKPGVHKTFSDQLADVIRQLRDDPEKVPVVHAPYVQKVCLWVQFWNV